MTTDRRSNTVSGESYYGIYKRDKYVLADDAEVTPGELLEVTEAADTPGYFEVQADTREGEGGPVILAEVRAHPPSGDQSRTPRLDIDYDEPGQKVEAFVPQSGDVSDNVFLGEDQDVAPGDALERAGDGTFQAVTDGEKVAEAQEAVTTDVDETERIEVMFA